jgi:hypothetical protein
VIVTVELPEVRPTSAPEIVYVAASGGVASSASSDGPSSSPLFLPPHAVASASNEHHTQGVDRRVDRRIPPRIRQNRYSFCKSSEPSE